MQRSGILIMLVVFLLALASTAAAQAPGQAEPMSAQFLEQRVNDELESEGVVLSNHNLGLKVEQLADKWLVALVELTTGRVADSTRIDQLPADREAAVAVITNVVETLEAQVLGRRERPEPQPPQVAQPPPVVPPPSPLRQRGRPSDCNARAPSSASSDSRSGSERSTISVTSMAYSTCTADGWRSGVTPARRSSRESSTECSAVMTLPGRTACAAPR